MMWAGIQNRVMMIVNSLWCSDICVGMERQEGKSVGDAINKINDQAR